MTELEQRIYECAKPTMTTEIIERLKSKETKGRWIKVPFICEGVFDFVIFDTEVNRFTKIEYSKGKGAAISGVMLHPNAGYFDDIEYCEFELPEPCVDSQ